MDKSMLSALNSQLQEKQLLATRIADSFKIEDGNKFVISTEQHADYVKAVKDAQEIKSLIDSATASHEIGQYLDAPEAPSAAGQFYGGAPTGSNFRGDEVTDLGSMFLESKAYQDARDGGFNGRLSIQANVEGKSIYNFNSGTVTHQAMGPADNLGIAEGMKRRTHIRDLFPKSTTKASVLYGVRETGWTNNARQLNQKYAADGVSPATGNDATDKWGSAPKSHVQLAPVMYPVAAIRHSLDAHKDILSDEGRLRAFLNTRMVDGVKYAEDQALLNSVGSGEAITGLYNVPGVQTYTGLNTDNFSVQIRRAITKAMLAEYEPTGLIISPTRWEQTEVEMDKQGQFRVAVSVSVGGKKQVWRLAVAETTAISDTNFVVGAFGMGAQLHDRESVSVSVSTEHGTNFTDGVVTFLAEERVAFEVNRPESFVIGTWTTPGVSAPGTN